MDRFEGRSLDSEALELALDRTLSTVPLRGRSGSPWLEVALADRRALLDDHCQCELKAATSALSLVARFPGHDSLVAKMSSLAKEEMHHYRIVRQVLGRRGASPSRLQANPYMKALGRGRSGGERALVEDLVIAAVVEARSCERFVVLARALSTGESADPELAALYLRLARSESGHARLFLDLAREYYSPSAVADEVGVRIEVEAEALAQLPPTPRMHGGMSGQKVLRKPKCQ